MKLILFLSILSFGFGYNTFNFYNLTSNPLEFHTCCSISPKLYNTTLDVIDHINSHDIINITIKDELFPHEVNSVNTICDYEDDYQGYGFTLLTDTDEDIYVSKKLLETNNTLYNVVLHEFIHALGLDHTTTPSIMKYKISVSSSLFGEKQIIEDKSKLYLSIDDMNGMRAVKKKYEDNINDE